MPRIHLLGTGAVLSDPHRTTTMLAIEEDGRTLLIDCGGDVIQRLLASGLAVDSICGMFITHEHPDHVSGFPLFMEKIWLAGRRRPIDLYGPGSALRAARGALSAFDTSRWDLPDVRWHVVEEVESVRVSEDTQWRISASPGSHGVPVLGLRFESLRSGGIAVYSSDTEPCPAIERLARNCDVLVHEATGPGPGHTSVEDAAALAARAGAGRLVLVHLPPGMNGTMLTAARRTFASTEFGEELGVIAF